ncbi:type 1 fimbrial protein [Salmonella enterica]|nr:type 1 fimbrial protein [Salmonella enterica]EGS7015751.1 type 1 fimbrial protein [Salmonella enterica]EHB8486201.1 type 1 fimbrial protein [Salmonella enterica]
MSKHGGHKRRVRLLPMVALSLPGVLSGFIYLESMQARAADLTVNFSGTLIERMCIFEPEDAALEVEFPNRAIKYFSEHPRTDTVAFDIRLKNCTAATQNKLVDLTFGGSSVTEVGGVPMLTTSGDTGVVIALVDSTGQAIKLGEAVETGKITHIGDGSVNIFSLGAYVMAPPRVTVKAGAYQATTTFTVSYR